MPIFWLSFQLKLLQPLTQSERPSWRKLKESAVWLKVCIMNHITCYKTTLSRFYANQPHFFWESLHVHRLIIRKSCWWHINSVRKVAESCWRNTGAKMLENNWNILQCPTLRCIQNSVWMRQTKSGTQLILLVLSDVCVRKNLCLLSSHSKRHIECCDILRTLTEVHRGESGQAGHGIGRLQLPPVPQQDVEDVVLGSGSQSALVHAAAHQLTVVDHHVCEKRKKIKPWLMSAGDSEEKVN